MQDLTNIVECYSCGLFVQKSDSSKFTQRCPRCDSKLKRKTVTQLIHYFLQYLV